MTPYSETFVRYGGAALLIAALAACSNGPARPPARSGASMASSTPAKNVASTRTEVDRTAADRRFKQALQLMREHQNAEAQAELIALSKDFPEFSGPLTALGILYAQGKQRNSALDSFAKATTANPENAVALNWLGSLYRETGNFKLAEESYLKALKAKPDYTPAQLNLGILYDVSLRQPDKAIKAYRAYQSMAGAQGNLMVGVWIKELEAGSAPRNAASGVAR